MKSVIIALLFVVGSCGSPSMAGSTLDLKKGERVIIYDNNHKRVGVIENRGYGRTQIRNNQNQITGYVEGNKTYDKNHRRTGTVEKQ